MDARKAPLLIGAGAAVVAVVAVVAIVRGAPTTIVGATDAGLAAATSAVASASASGEPMASAVASVASASASASAEPAASAAPRTARDAGAVDTVGAGVGAGADAAAPAEAGASRPQVVRIDESHEGKTLELTAGQQLVATLNANPTTGFDWAVIKAPAALGSPAMGYVSSSDVPGAPGKRILTWTLKAALPAGDHAVELGYARSFEKGVPPFKTYRFKVRAGH